EFPQKRAAEIYRQYHERDPAIRTDIVATPPELLQGYEEAGIDMRSTVKDRSYRWDAEVLRMFANYGTSFFRKVDIWEADWAAAARVHGVTLTPTQLDPRSALDKLVFRWL